MNPIERLLARLSGSNSSISSEFTPDHQADITTSAPGITTKLTTFGDPTRLGQVSIEATAQSSKGGHTHTRFRLF